MQDDENFNKLKELAGKIPIIGVIFSNIEFWKDLSLLISLCLNILNFFWLNVLKFDL